MLSRENICIVESVEGGRVTPHKDHITQSYNTTQDELHCNTEANYPGLEFLMVTGRSK